MHVLAVARESIETVAFAGGTLLRLAERGDEVFMAEFPSEPAHVEHDDGASIAEALKATWLGTIRTDATQDSRPLRDPLIDMIRAAAAEVIVVSSISGAEAVPLTELVFNAAYCSTLPMYKTASGSEAVPTRAPIYATDTPFTSDFEPDTYVDVSQQWAQKLALLERHGRRYATRDVAEAVARARGIQVQVVLAEAFRTEAAWGRLRPHRLLP
jgi:LmbE family N-acetylglucosaminyl deacetylase